MILAKLLLAHILGDFFLQPKNWVDHKNNQKWKSPYLWLHAGIHFILIIVVLWKVEIWPVAAAIAVSHLIIDGIKLSFQSEKNLSVWFTADQIAHLFILIAVWYFYWGGFEFHMPGDTVWIIGLGALFITFPASIIMQKFMIRWNKQIDTQNDGTLDGAGTYIGILERIFIYLVILSSNIQIIGFLLAAKSVFRFGDLSRSEDRKLTEYILIGTLLSFLIAILTGVIVAEAIKYF